MQLRHAPTSPYARKVRVLIHEAGLMDRIELVATNPYEDSDLSAFNPLSTVPVLQTDDGMLLCDSPVICAYLDSLQEGESFTPDSGKARFEDLNLQALADGLLDAALSRMGEIRLRPEALQWDGHHERMRAKVSRVLDLFEKLAAEGNLRSIAQSARPSLGHIAVGCALGYLDLRFSAENWRDGRTALTAWYETFSGRPSMQDTRPPEA